jgi:hypothetical protein
MWCILMNVPRKVEKNMYCNVEVFFKCQLDAWTQGLVFARQVLYHFSYIGLQPLEADVFVWFLLCFGIVW